MRNPPSEKVGMRVGMRNHLMERQIRRMVMSWQLAMIPDGGKAKSGTGDRGGDWGLEGGYDHLYALIWLHTVIISTY